MDVSTWVDKTRRFFSGVSWMFDRRNQERNRYSEGNMAVNYAELPSRTISEAFSFNDGETTLGVQFKPNIVPIKPNVDYHQYLNVMNDNKCSTRLYFGLTMEEDQQLWKPRFQNVSWQTQRKRQLASTDWQCHHQG